MTERRSVDGDGENYLGAKVLCSRVDKGNTRVTSAIGQHPCSGARRLVRQRQRDCGRGRLRQLGCPRREHALALRRKWLGAPGQGSTTLGDTVDAEWPDFLCYGFSK
jgi:hypothetical protein